jgi:hypothetical protein
MLYDLIIVQFSKMLGNLNHILDKANQNADSRKIQMEVLLNSRLAPDQFNFIRQIQIACDTAKLCAARISGKDAPSHDDSEKTLIELKTRIEDTIKYLKGFSEKDFAGGMERHISQPRWEGKYLTGYEYVVQHAVPNIYFHITTAYSILRHNGVDIGKKDYLGEMPFKK